MPTRTRRWYARPWIAPLGVLTVLFLVFSLPPYLSLDPATSRLPIPEQYPWFYPALVIHIGFGTIALLTACLQVWPWLRRTHPAIHRWSGRLYVFAGVLPAGVIVLTITVVGRAGPNQQVANTMLALLWLITTVAGYRAVRARRYAEHREWMLRSVALSFSIVTNRVWGIVCFLVFAPDTLTSATPDPVAMSQAIGASTWLSWVVNLLIVEWWLHRSRHRARRGGDQRTTSDRTVSRRA